MLMFLSTRHQRWRKEPLFMLMALRAITVTAVVSVIVVVVACLVSIYVYALIANIIHFNLPAIFDGVSCPAHRTKYNLRWTTTSYVCRAAAQRNMYTKKFFVRKGRNTRASCKRLRLCELQIMQHATLCRGVRLCRHIICI